MSSLKAQRLAAALAVACAMGMIAAGVAMASVVSQRRFETRGSPGGFPGPIQNVSPRPWGVNVALEQYDQAALRRNLDAIQSAGLTWVRQTFPWSKIEPARGQFDWAASDRIMSAVASPGAAGASQSLGALQVIAVLDTCPAWAQSVHDSLPPAAGHPPSDPADFAKFAGEFARRYGDRIHVYQIWDEPNLGDRWNGEVNPVAYAELLRQARQAILASDPHAIILLAGLAPTVENSRVNKSDWLYLRRLYEAGAGEYFDAASGKPYGFSTGPYDRRVDPAVLNFSHIILMREEMVRHGDAGKALWASHAGWNSLPSGWTGQPSLWGQVTRDDQIRFTQQAIQRVQLEWPWLGVMALENWQPAAPQDDPRWGFAVADWIGRLGSAVAARQGAAYQPAAQPQPLGAGTLVPGPASFLPLAHWSFSELGADWSESGDRVVIPFYGAGLALNVRRAADRANLYVTVDGQPANALPRDSRGAFLQLIPADVDHASVDLLPVAAGLPLGQHTAEIVAERGWNQRSLVGWSVQVEAATGRYDGTLIALALASLACAGAGVVFARRAGWPVLARAASVVKAWLGRAAHAMVMVITALVLYASLWATWSPEVPAAFRRIGDGAGLAAMLGLSVLFYYSPWLYVALLSALILFVLVLLRLDLGLMLVALFVPFYMLPRAINQYMFSMTEIILVMCGVSWLLRLLARAGRQARRQGLARVSGRAVLTSVLSRLSALDWAALIFVGVAFASLFVSDYLKYAAREFRGVVVEPALFYLMVRTEVKRPSALWRIVDALMLAGLIVAVVGLIQYAFNIDIITAEAGQRRLRSVYGSPNNVGLFLGRVLPVMVAVACLGKGWRRWAYGLGAAPVALAILFSFSKGALLLGVPAALLLLGVLAGGRWLKAAVVAVGAGGLAAIPLLQTPRFRSLLDLTSGTSFFRINVWQSALRMIRDHPLLGVGLDNFLYQYRGRYMFPEAWAEPMLSHPHNMLLDYAARMGLLGLAAGLGLQVAFWRAAWPLRKLHSPLDRALALGLMASMADFLAHGLVDAAYFVVDLAYVFFMTLAFVQVLAPEPGRNPPASDEGDRYG